MQSTATKSKKGFSEVIWMVVYVVIAIAVLGIVVTFTTNIIEDEHVDICPSTDSYKAVGSYTDGVNGNNTVANPVTNAKFGCCQSSNTTDCLIWRTNNYAVNASFDSLTAQTSISEKQGTIGNVAMAGAIIMILMAAFGGFALYSKKR